MDIKRAKQEIMDAAAAYFMKDGHGGYEIPVIRQRPLLLIGAPGIGKTQIIEQVAKECGLGLVSYTITHHTRQSAVGLPYISKNNYGGKEYEVTEYTMSEIVASVYEKMKKTGLTEGILFLDEINCVSETLAPAMLQFLQCKSFGNHKIPEGWMIVAAGNPPEYNKSVREFDVVTMDRIKKIEVEPDFAVWKEYAGREQVHGAVVSYLSTKPAYFYQMEMTADGMQFATPRGWEDLSKLIQVYEKLGKTADREVVQQYIQHPEIAKDFANYLELFYKYQTDYQMDAVLRGELDEILLKKASHASFDERLSIVYLLHAKLAEEFRRIYKKEAETEALFQCLKSYKSRISPETDARELLKEIGEETQNRCEERKKAELLGREEEYALLETAGKLESYYMILKKEGIREGSACFDRVRGLFAKEKEAYQSLREHASGMLEYAFDFMEAVFGEGQEMAVFLTELNAGFYSRKFLGEYECGRYYQYNKNLLFDEKERSLLQRIERL